MNLLFATTKQLADMVAGEIDRRFGLEASLDLDRSGKYTVIQSMDLACTNREKFLSHGLAEAEFFYPEIEEIRELLVMAMFLCVSRNLGEVEWRFAFNNLSYCPSRAAYASQIDMSHEIHRILAPIAAQIHPLLSLVYTKAKKTGNDYLRHFC